MNWTARKIQQLRLELGWSQAELGRRLGVASNKVAAWEVGMNIPSSDVLHNMDRLAVNLREYNSRLKRSSMAEGFLKAKALNQIADFEMDEDKEQYDPRLSL